MSNHKRRTVLKSVGGVAVIGTLAGCTGGGTDEESTDGSDEEMNDSEETDGSEESEPEPDASLRVAHLSPDAPNVDVYLDGDAVLEDVPYRTVSDYLDVASGTYEVMITAAGDMETVVFDEELDVPAADITVAAIGELAEENEPFAVEVYEDDLSDPGENARIRLAHAAPDAPNVDVTAGGDVLFEDVPFGAAGAIEVPAGEYELEVRPATEDNDGDVVATFDVAPEAGVVYSGFAVGYLEPNDAPADEPFDLELVVDADMGGSEESEPEPDASLQVAHLSPDAPNVDVYLDGDAVLEDVPYRTVSDYLDVASGTYEVMITAAGDMETVVFDEEFDVPAADITVAAIGELAEENEPFAVEVYEDDLSDPGEDARVRLVHAAPDAPSVDVTAGGDALFEDVPFGAAGAIEVPAGEYELEVRPATEDNDGDVVATFDVAPEAGVVYSGFAVGYLEPDDAPADEPFDLELVVDAE